MKTNTITFLFLLGLLASCAGKLPHKENGFRSPAYYGKSDVHGFSVEVKEPYLVDTVYAACVATGDILVNLKKVDRSFQNTSYTCTKTAVDSSSSTVIVKSIIENPSTPCQKRDKTYHLFEYSVDSRFGPNLFRTDLIERLRVQWFFTTKSLDVNHGSEYADPFKLLIITPRCL